ncbi:MAG: hypothetical protein ACUVWZ_16175 [Anaerolineae bacterium]
MEDRKVVRNRPKVVFILLVLILVMASLLFGILTYWLGGEHWPPFSFKQEGQIFRDHLSSISMTRSGEREKR